MKEINFRRFRYLLVFCLIVFALAINIGSIDDSDDDGELDGIWKLKSYDDDDGSGCGTFNMSGEDYSIFVKVTGDEVRFYLCNGDICSYCSDDDGDIDEIVDYSLSGDILTTYFDNDTDCRDKQVYEKASSSDIENSEEDCSYND